MYTYMPQSCPLCPLPPSPFLAFQRGMKFLSTSAKTGDNVEEAFVTLARSILQAGQGKPSTDGAKSHRLHVSWLVVGIT